MGESKQKEEQASGTGTASYTGSGLQIAILTTSRHVSNLFYRCDVGQLCCRSLTMYQQQDTWASIRPEAGSCVGTIGQEYSMMLPITMEPVKYAREFLEETIE